MGSKFWETFEGRKWISLGSLPGNFQQSTRGVSFLFFQISTDPSDCSLIVAPREHSLEISCSEDMEVHPPVVIERYILDCITDNMVLEFNDYMEHEVVNELHWWFFIPIVHRIRIELFVVPPSSNLVFFSPVFSKILSWDVLFFGRYFHQVLTPFNLCFLNSPFPLHLILAFYHYQSLEQSSYPESNDCMEHKVIDGLHWYNHFLSFASVPNLL